jgi:hypothetical protein
MPCKLFTNGSLAPGHVRDRVRDRDVCWRFAYGWATLVLRQGTYAIVNPNALTAPYLLNALGTLLAVPPIAYGILKAQLFDIDLKIQWTI